MYFNNFNDISYSFSHIFYYSFAIRETFGEEGNVTTSILEFTPSAEDHGSYLNCRAENLRLANSSIEDQWILNIFCSYSVFYKNNNFYSFQSMFSFFLFLCSVEPKVNLTMKTNSAKGLVVEGSQLFMECQIFANPSVVEVKWLFNGKPIKQDIERGMQSIDG